MENQTTSEIIQEERQGISLEDGQTIIKIVEKALSYRPYIQKAMLGAEFQALPPEKQLDETLTPRIAYHYVDKLPTLFFRFVGDESPVVEALIYPIESANAFLEQARWWVQGPAFAELTDEEREIRAIEYAVEMFLIMLDTFYQRAESMMDSFVLEVISQWNDQNYQRYAQYKAELGEPVPRQKGFQITKHIERHAKEVSNLWKYQGQSQINIRKMMLAEEYDGILRHWQFLSKLSRTNTDWREYAQAGKFQDTPDDLLDKLENTDRLDDAKVSNKLSDLALEHAARRVRFIKMYGVGDEIKKKRKDKILETGYSSGQLFDFRKEGMERLVEVRRLQEISAQRDSQLQLEQNDNPAQIDSAKLSEQKLLSGLEESGSKSEQN